MAVNALDDIGTAPPWMRKTTPAAALPGSTPLGYGPAPAGAVTDPTAAGYGAMQSTDIMGGPSAGATPMPKAPALGSSPSSSAPSALPAGWQMGADGQAFFQPGGGYTPPVQDNSYGRAQPFANNGVNVWQESSPSATGSDPAASYSAALYPSSNPAMMGGAPASGGGTMPPISGTTGIDIMGRPAWQGGPVVDATRVGAGDLPSVSTDFSGDAQRGADAAYSGATQFLNKDFDRSNAALEAKLVGQGFAPGSEAFDAEMEKQRREQDSIRQNAAFQAQGVGFDQAGQLLSRALAARAAMYGERSTDADRLYAQSLGIANLGLGARGQDKGVETANIGASASMANSGAAADASKYSSDVNANVALRRLGLDQSNSDVQNLISLIASSRGGVNMPNFGTPSPLDVGSAYSIASGNSNSAANRSAANNAALAQLAGAALGSYFRG